MLLFQKRLRVYDDMGVAQLLQSFKETSDSASASNGRVYVPLLVALLAEMGEAFENSVKAVSLDVVEQVSNDF